jgi:hypothetical protein
MSPLADAIDLVAIAHPYRTQDGGGEIWCGHRSGGFPDARFDDWGLARAVALILNAVVEGKLAPAEPSKCLPG